MPILIAPALVGILVDHGQFSESYAGWVIASGSLGVAALLMFISVRIHNLNLKKLAGLSLGVDVIIDIYSSFSANPPQTRLQSCTQSLLGSVSQFLQLSALASPPQTP